MAADCAGAINVTCQNPGCGIECVASTIEEAAAIWNHRADDPLRHELEEVIGTSDWEEAVRRVKAWQDRAESAVDLVQQLRGAWCSEHCTFNGNLCNECVEKDCTGRQTQQWLTAGAGE